MKKISLHSLYNIILHMMLFKNSVFRRTVMSNARHHRSLSTRYKESIIAQLDAINKHEDDAQEHLTVLTYHREAILIHCDSSLYRSMYTDYMLSRSYIKYRQSYDVFMRSYDSFNVKCHSFDKASDIYDKEYNITSYIEAIKKKDKEARASSDYFEKDATEAYIYSTDYYDKYCVSIPHF